MQSLAMKLFSIVPLFAAAAHAAPFNNLVVRPMIPIDVFNVTGFEAYSVPHSSWSYARFNISVTTISPVARCYAETPGYQHIGDFAENICTERTVAFNLTRTADNGAKLGIFWKLGDTGLMQGTYFIAGDQFTTSGVGTSVHEDYTGPTSFTISNLTLLHSILGN